MDESEAGGLAASKVGLEAEGENAVGGALVHLGQLFADLYLVDGGSVGVEHVDDHLLAGQKPVRHELARTHGHCALRLKENSRYHTLSI